MSKFVKAKEAALFYNTSIPNVRKWARKGKIPVKYTEGGHYLYKIPVVGEEEPELGACIIYARVSSKNQKEDLERQVTFLKKLYPDYEVVKDIGSGINYKRRGFRSILERLFKGAIRTVVVAHQDRFSRFGFEFFEWMFSEFGAVLECAEKSETHQEDMVEDIMEIFTVFSARYYGKRKYERKGGNKKNQDLSESDTEDSI